MKDGRIETTLGGCACSEEESIDIWCYASRIDEDRAQYGQSQHICVYVYDISARVLLCMLNQRFLQWVVMKLKCGFPFLKGLGKRFFTHTQEPFRRSIS